MCLGIICELIKERLEYVLNELKTIQDQNSKDANFKGYLSGVPNGKQMWLKFKSGNAGAQNGYWVPWYNIHKTFAGLRDAYIYGGYEQAKTMFLALCDWGLTITGGLNDNAMESMLGTEHGGMDEVYADAYALTKNEKYLKEAKRWSHKWLLNAMAAGNDNLTNIHGAESRGFCTYRGTHERCDLCKGLRVLLGPCGEQTQHRDWRQQHLGTFPGAR